MEENPPLRGTGIWSQWVGHLARSNGSFFDQIENVTTRLAPKVVLPEEGALARSPGNIAQSKLQSSDTGGQFGFAINEVEPGAGPPLHMHTLEDEVFYVLEGEVEFTVGTEKILAGPGTTVFGPRGTPHTFKGAGGSLAKFALFVTGDNFEKFYGKWEAALAAGPDWDLALKAAAEHGIQIFQE